MILDRYLARAEQPGDSDSQPALEHLVPAAATAAAKQAEVADLNKPAQGVSPTPMSGSLGGESIHAAVGRYLLAVSCFLPAFSNGFSLSEPPFHKALNPGQHRIELTFVRDDWDVPEDYRWAGRVDYRVTVPDTQPMKVSLKEILQERADKVRILKNRWNPDFIPLEGGEGR